MTSQSQGGNYDDTQRILGGGGQAQN